jgi:uncharacterized protein with HEPN domain
MYPRDQASLLDIVKAAQSILAFVKGMTLDDFTADVKTQSAVLYQIAIIGEAAKRLSPEFRAQYSTLDWRAMAGMRDKLIHDYGNVDTKRVWLTVQGNIPQLLSELSPLLPERSQ